jgi:hypothetical protein
MLDEGEAAEASIDVCAELGIERDGSLQQEGRDGLVLETAGADARFIDGRQIGHVFVKRGANSLEITKRRKEFERAGKQAFAPKQLQQPLGAGLEEALARRWHHDRAGVDQQLCALGASEDLFSVRHRRRCRARASLPVYGWSRETDGQEEISKRSLRPSFMNGLCPAEPG